MRWPSPYTDGEGSIHGEATVKSNRGNRRGKGNDTNPIDSRSKLGKLWKQENALEIIHKPVRRSRDSDVAIVSEEAGGQKNRWRSQGPLDWWCDQKGEVPVGESPLRNKRPTRRASAGAAYKRKARRWPSREPV